MAKGNSCPQANWVNRNPRPVIPDCNRLIETIREGSCRERTVEFKHVRPHRWLYPRTVADHDEAPVRLRHDTHGRARSGVLPGVLEQVDEETLQDSGMALNRV